MPRLMLSLLLSLICVVPCVSAADAEKAVDTSRGDAMLAEYFRTETKRLQERCLSEVKTLEDWQARRGEYRRQLFEMLGLDPLPPRTDMKAEVTGRVEHDDFVVEKIQFQSRPGLYVTGSLYLPREAKKPLPAVLYVCGHGASKEDGVSYGTKATYQHHGGWFARNGYVCLTIDTLQLGEIEGIHHGTYRYDMWWWLNRGYTPAGVEAWNCIRSLDYLQSRDEVDGERLGVTGRSGGGAYSWWIAALDDRVKTAVPVAGITDLENHVVDGCVEGHCDCMFMVNTYRWDYPLVAALVAPRPLLISNTDRDGIFPLDGVVRTYESVRRIYELHGAGEKVALNITAGPHKDTQELRVHAFRWFDEHLKGVDRLVDKPAVKFFKPPQLKVFDELPEDERNTEIHETFVAAASNEVPEDAEQWQSLSKTWRSGLEQKVFAGWPSETVPLNVSKAFSAEQQGVVLRAYDFDSQANVRLRVYLLHRADLKEPELTVVNALDQASWDETLAMLRPTFKDALKDELLPAADQAAWDQTRKMLESSDWVMAYVAPRGVGPTIWDQSPRKQVQHRRRFYLLGQTLEGMQVWDVRRAVQAVRHVEGLSRTPVWLQAERQMAGVALYAALFEPGVKRLDLHELPHTHRDGPYLLNVSKILDLPQAVALAAEKASVVVYDADTDAWHYPAQVQKQLGWPEKQLQLRTPPVAGKKSGG